MALQRQYDTLEDIPEELRSIYTEHEGKYVLDVEPGEGERNAEDVRRALRARDNEKAERDRIKTQLDELQAKLRDVDPARLPDALEALKRVDDLEHQRLLDEKKFEEAAEKKFERQIADLTRQIEAMKQQLEQSGTSTQAILSELAKERIEGGLTQEFISAGADPQKVRYLVLDAKDKWELDPESRSAVPIDYIDGGATKVTATGADGQPLSMKEQVKSILAEHPWAVLESSGSGASHQTGTAPNGAIVLTEAEASNFQRYKTAKAQAEERKVELQIVPNS